MRLHVRACAYTRTYRETERETEEKKEKKTERQKETQRETEREREFVQAENNLFSLLQFSTTKQLVFCITHSLFRLCKSI